MEHIDVHHVYILAVSVASCCFVYLIALALSSRLSRHDYNRHDADVDADGSTMSASDTSLELITHDPPPSLKQAEISSSLDELSTHNSIASSSSVIHGDNKLKKRNKGSKGSVAATPGSIVSNAIDHTPVPRRVSFTSEVELSCNVPSVVTAAAATAQSNNLSSSQSVRALPAPSLISSRNNSLGSLLKPSGGSLIKQSQASKKSGKESIEVRYAKEVRLIVEMGFEMKKAVEAIEKSLGNVDSAVSWLLMSSSELDDKFADAPPVSTHGGSTSNNSRVTAAAIGVSPSAEDEVDTTNESKDSSPPLASVEEHVFVNTNTATLPALAQQQLLRAVRSPQPCRHFLTRYGCRQGSRCKFLHDPSLADARRDSSTVVHRSDNDTWIDNRRGNNDYARGSKPSSIHQVATRPDNSVLVDRSRVSNSSMGARLSNDGPISSRQPESTRWRAHAHTGNDLTATGRVSNMSVDSRPTDSNSNNSRWLPKRHFDTSDPYNDTQNLFAFVHKDLHAVGNIAAANDPISPVIGPAKNAPKSPVIGPANSSKHSSTEKYPVRRDQSVPLPPSRYPIDPSFGSFDSNSHRDVYSYRHRSSDTTGVHPMMIQQVSQALPEQQEVGGSRWFGACPPSSIGASSHFVYTSTGLVLQSEQQRHTVESTSSNDSVGHYIYVGGVLKPL